jgi:quinol monooxygenase YgiN
VGNDDPNLFIFYENWQSKPELNAHLKTPLLTAFFNRRMDLLEEDVEMHFMTMDRPYDK